MSTLCLRTRCHLAVALIPLLLLLPSRANALDDCWRPPADAPVSDPFRPPACPWCAGNRGIEYRTPAGATVVAAAPGRVAFSGDVAGTRYVVVELPTGWRLTYGGLASTALRRGDIVLDGATIGTTAGRLHFGLRIGDDYHDPAPFLGWMVGVRRLLPLDGSASRPAPPARLRCS